MTTNVDHFIRTAENEANRLFNSKLRKVVNATFEYIMDNSPVYTGAYKSNNQVTLNGLGGEEPNKSTSEERKEAEDKGNRRAGPRGIPVSGFSGLIQDAHLEAKDTINDINIKTTNSIHFVNTSDHAESVENQHGYEVYGNAEVFFKGMVAKVDKEKA